MAYFVLLTKLTDEGRRTIKSKPERIKEVNMEIEAMGGNVISQYAVLGGYDFVSIMEAPSNEVVAKISIELGARGTVHITSLPAIPIENFIKNLK